MTNIRDFWPLEASPLTREVWADLLELRYQTFTGFATLEQDQGIVRPTVNLSTAVGQETLRLLAFRVIEELGEAHLSIDKDHYYEELIDAFNYLLSLTLLEGKVKPELLVQLEVSTPVIGKHPSRMNFSTIGYCAVELGGKLGDYLRNRPWMHHAQSTYFDGDLVVLIKTTMETILSLFPDESTFYKYYVAKDSVLQFRLRSKY